MTLPPKNSYVELRDGCDDVYELAWSGTRGWIRDLDVDEDGFEKVFVEWDKDHWRYDGEPDGWTYASHFKPVSSVDIPSEETLKGPELVDAQNIPHAVDAMKRGQLWDSKEMEDYIDSLTHAFDQASESDGFILVTMKVGQDPEMGQVIMYEMARGSALPTLTEIPGSAILSFISEQMRLKGH